MTMIPMPRDLAWAMMRRMSFRRAFGFFERDGLGMDIVLMGGDGEVDPGTAHVGEFVDGLEIGVDTLRGPDELHGEAAHLVGLFVVDTRRSLCRFDDAAGGNGWGMGLRGRGG